MSTHGSPSASFSWPRTSLRVAPGDRVGRAELEGGRAAVLGRVGDDHRAGAERRGGHRRRQPHAAAADDEHDVTRDGRGDVEDRSGAGRDAAAEQRGDVVGDGVGDGDEAADGEVHPGGEGPDAERPVERLALPGEGRPSVEQRALGGHEAAGQAQLARTAEAHPAATARRAHPEDDAGPLGQPVDPGAEADDGAGGLVAEQQRHRVDHLPVTQAEVGAADPGGGEVDLDLAGARVVDLDVVDDPDLATRLGDDRSCHGHAGTPSPREVGGYGTPPACVPASSGSPAAHRRDPGGSHGALHRRGRHRPPA
jgi:hypothetical protein